MTIKQKAVAKDIMENHGKPISQAMLDAGYDPSSAKNPSNLTESKGWAELMEKYLPDDLVLDTHRAGLTAMKQLSVRGGKDANAESDDFIEVEDHPTRLKAVELAYKVKKKLTPEGVSGSKITIGDKAGNTITFTSFKNES
jgi:hypothetical protein